jgi:hypothetical protein
MFTDATNYGVDATYNDSLGTISLEGRALFLHVYNDTGSTLNKGKAVYVTGYDSTKQQLQQKLLDLCTQTSQVLHQERHWLVDGSRK